MRHLLRKDALSSGALFGIAVVLALAVRLQTWPAVFAGGEVRLLGDTDPHYHVLHAQRMAIGEPKATWLDPRLDWPNGARIPWPPLFDAMLAASARIASPHPELSDVAAVAVFVPPIIGALAVLAVGLLGAALAGRTAGVAAALAVAIMPAHAVTSMLGRVDQHVLEILLSVTTWGLFVVSWRNGLRPGVAVAGGVVLALAFWNWMGSALVLCFPASAVVLLWAFSLDGALAAAKALAISTATGAALLAGSVAVLAPPGALSEASLLGVGGLHVAVLAGCSAFCAVLAGSRRWRGADAGPGRRLAELALALTIPAFVLLAGLPAIRAGALHGLRVLGARGAWYGNIAEFQPLFGSGTGPLREELRFAAAYFGLFPVAALIGSPILVAHWRSDPTARPSLAVLVLWTALATILGLARIRFGPYAAAVIAVAFGAELAWIAALAAKRTGVAGKLATLALGVSIAGLPSAGYAQPAVGGAAIDALRWLRTQPSSSGGDGVAADWDLGHLVQYYAGRPVLVTPFGTEAGEQAMADWAAVVFADDDGTAERILTRRRIGWIVLQDSPASLAYLHPFAPPGTPAVAEVTRSWRTGERIHALPALRRTFYFRVFVADGLSIGGKAVEGVRLLHEAGSGLGPWQYVKVFGVVPGARILIHGARPGGSVTAALQLRTSGGRSLKFVEAADVAADGTAEVRVPYATGANGTTLAGPLRLSQDSLVASVSISEGAVANGERIEVRLGAEGSSTRPTGR